MNIAQKLERAGPVLDGIILHHDGDSALRKAALDEIIARCEAGKLAIDAEVQALVDGLAA